MEPRENNSQNILLAFNDVWELFNIDTSKGNIEDVLSAMRDEEIEFLGRVLFVMGLGGLSQNTEHELVRLAANTIQEAMDPDSFISLTFPHLHSEFNFELFEQEFSLGLNDLGVSASHSIQEERKIHVSRSFIKAAYNEPVSALADIVYISSKVRDHVNGVDIGSNSKRLRESELRAYAVRLVFIGSLIKRGIKAPNILKDHWRRSIQIAGKGAKHSLLDEKGEVIEGLNLEWPFDRLIKGRQNLN